MCRKRLTISLDQELYDKIAQRAALDDRSVSNQIMRMLKEDMEDENVNKINKHNQR